MHTETTEICLWHKRRVAALKFSRYAASKWLHSTRVSYRVEVGASFIRLLAPLTWDLGSFIWQADYTRSVRAPLEIRLGCNLIVVFAATQHRSTVCVILTNGKELISVTRCRKSETIKRLLHFHIQFAPMSCSLTVPLIHTMYLVRERGNELEERWNASNDGARTRDKKTSWGKDRIGSKRRNATCR